MEPNIPSGSWKSLSAKDVHRIGGKAVVNEAFYEAMTQLNDAVDSSVGLFGLLSERLVKLEEQANSRNGEAAASGFVLLTCQAQDDLTAAFAAVDKADKLRRAM
jgi:hypothetical protein